MQPTQHNRFADDSFLDTKLKLAQENAALCVKRLKPAIGVSLLLAFLLVLLSELRLQTPLCLGMTLSILVISLGRFWHISRLLRDFVEDVDDEVCRTKIDKVTLICAVADSALWLAVGWALLAGRLLEANFYLAMSIAAAATYGVIYFYNLRSAALAAGIIITGSAISSVAYVDGITFTQAVQTLTLCAVFSGVIGVALFRQSATLNRSMEGRIRSDLMAARANEANFVFNQHWQNTPLAAIEWDQRFRICSWNPSAETIFGYKAEEALGQHISLIFQGEDLERTKKKWRALWRNKKGFRSIHSCINKDGQSVECEWHDAAVMRNGVAIGIASFVEDITAQVKAEALIKQQANFDSLTGLPNRRRMMQEISKAVSRSKRSREFAALVFLDLDHFKDINDTQGHDAGDIVLTAFAKKVSELVRAEDMVARFGGDEFVVLLENLGQSQAEAAKNLEGITRKILHSGQGLCKIGDVEHDLDLSCGVVVFDGSWEETDILKKADLAMYRVKQDGRKGISFYDDSLTIETEYRVELVRGLRRGLENQEFDLHFQPIVDNAGNIIYAEALLRWIRPPNKVIPAGTFIEILANSPMMSSVGYWIIDRVCQGIKHLMEDGLWRDGRAFFINISAKQLMEENFTEKVKAILQANAIDPALVVFEITEDSLIQNYDDVLVQLRHLLELGIRVALDDFGTGYSSLAMLKNLPVHFVKLDREFINSLLDTENNYQIVNAIIKLCEVLSLKVIAEGIEERQQFTVLKKLNCDFYQGYLFHKPMPMGSLVDELSNKKSAEFGGRHKVEHLRLVE